MFVDFLQFSTNFLFSSVKKTRLVTHTRCIIYVSDGVKSCNALQVLGTAVTKISRSAKDGYIDDFCESVRRFAAAVSRIILITSQVFVCPMFLRNPFRNRQSTYTKYKKA